MHKNIIILVRLCVSQDPSNKQNSIHVVSTDCKEEAAYNEKELNDAICSNMDGPRGYHTKWNKLEKDKYHIISLICGT